MNIKRFPLLVKKDQKTLSDALYYMNMAELKDSCRALLLPDSGKKGEIIKRIIIFIQTGSILKSSTIPATSQAKNYPKQALNKDALMLYGSYKNDAQTRALFKQLIGPHFHFTAFGIDWLNDRWQKSKPPTYQEFADYWQKETNRRKIAKAQPKQEWAFINFLQQSQKSHPSISQVELMRSWKKLRAQKVEIAQKIIRKILNEN